MGFKNNICFMFVMAFILLLTVSLVSASEVDSNAGVINNDNELLASNVGYVENGVQSDLNLKSTENVEMDDSGILSSNQEDSLGEDGIDDDPIDYHDVNGMKLIPSEMFLAALSIAISTVPSINSRIFFPVDLFCFACSFSISDR